MKPRHKRLAFIVIGLVGVAVAAGLVLNSFRGNLVFFFSPSQVAAKEAPVGKTFRLGGMVEKGSVQRDQDGLTVRFVVTDTARNIPVVFTGILPDLFSEGQGAVAQGRLGDDGVFYADTVLAKHDETYMPPEVADALEQAKAANSSPAMPGAASLIE
ncbi:MAG: cytochrome c maturation protein CcmE [Gammaproteobacteria bacterium]|nr:cytochrome c maturation protein CcmE [Gammaproteobacteria bacterium]